MSMPIISKKLVRSILFLLLLFPHVLFAQQAVIATGGYFSGSGGTMSSSAGQTDYIYLSNEAWSIQFGVQQQHKAHVVNITPDPTEGGAIIGGGNHPIGSEVSLMAQANPGWEFVMWIGNFIEVPPDKNNSQSTSNPIVILIQEDTYITAVFQLLNPVAVPISSWAVYLGIALIILFVIIRFNKAFIFS